MAITFVSFDLRCNLFYAKSRILKNQRVLTESISMTPASSVSGWYFAHPESHYFGVGKITEEQVVSLAKRKGMELEVMKKWLSSNLEN